MIKKLLFILAIAFVSKTKAQVYGANNFTLCSKIDPETYVNSYGGKYSACWGWYQANKNKEYAIAGSASGTYWIDVTNPYTPTVSCFRPGKNNITVWREMKTYQNYCYVVSDVHTPNSFQIFDMQYLPDSVHKVYDGKGLFERGHAAWVDGDKLYVSGVTYSTGATDIMNVYSLATPTAPTLIRKLKTDAPFLTGVHDAYANNDTVFVSAGYQGLYVFLLTSPSNTFQQLGSLTTYPFSGYNHSSALTPDRKTLVFMDEVPSGKPIKVTDVQNLSNISVLSTFNQYTPCTPHNPWMVNDSLCFVASYVDGVQLLNIKNPSAPFLAGYFDTHPQSGGNVSSYPDPYDGLWGLYPYLPSKNIFALDQQNGVFMLKTNLYTNTITLNENELPPSGVGTTTGTILTGLVNQTASDFIINPNPASSRIRFTIPSNYWNEDIQVEIMDIKGSVVFNQTTSEIKNVGTNLKEINLLPYDNGIYFIRLSLNNTVLKNSKLIIAR